MTKEISVPEGPGIEGSQSPVRKIRWGRDRLPTSVSLGFPCGSAGKEFTCNAGDLGSIPGLGKSPGEGKGYPLHYSGLERLYSPWDHSQTQLSHFHFTSEPCWVGGWRLVVTDEGEEEEVLEEMEVRREGFRLLCEE